MIQYYPNTGKKILTKTGADFVKSIGNEALREAVSSVMGGENVRNSTEFITRRRLLLSNSALFMMFVDGCLNIENFSEKLIPEVTEKLKEKGLKKSDKWILEWILGLNDKAVQNILRDDPEELDKYKDRFQNVLEDTQKQVLDSYGVITLSLIKDNKQEVNFDWDLLMKLFLAIGAQTLTIRGSEKSTYGKLFEKLILGTLLEILGFQLVDQNNIPSKPKMVFWLSQTDKRESDATLIYKPGKGIRFDIGFIGRGNPEISLDKVTRFERELVIGEDKHYMGTYIIVDRIGEKSKISDLAKRVGGDIVQMSYSLWIKEIAELLDRDLDYSHPILGMSESELNQYIKEKISQIDITKFI